jgi:hypothetical protein
MLTFQGYGEYIDKRDSMLFNFKEGVNDIKYEIKIVSFQDFGSHYQQMYTVMANC